MHHKCSNNSDSVNSGASGMFMPLQNIINKGVICKIFRTKDLGINSSLWASVCVQNIPVIGVTVVKELSPGFPGLSFVLF
jgi:hypothetical protein